MFREASHGAPRPQGSPLLVWITVVMVAGAALLAPPASGPAAAHGSTQDPPSRVYGCRFETPDDPMCASAWSANPQALYDWMEVNIGDAAGQHRARIPDGQLCSAGRSKYAAFDRPGAWPSTALRTDGSGRAELIYRSTAPHATEYYRVYLTRSGFDARTDALTWADLELVLDSGRLDASPEHRLLAPLPERAVPAVLYVVWQRSDSPEAFYACSDVTIGGGSGGPTTTTAVPTTTTGPPTTARPTTTTVRSSVPSTSTPTSAPTSTPTSSPTIRASTTAPPSDPSSTPTTAAPGNPSSVAEPSPVDGGPSETTPSGSPGSGADRSGAGSSEGASGVVLVVPPDQPPSTRAEATTDPGSGPSAGAGAEAVARSGEVAAPSSGAVVGPVTEVQPSSEGPIPGGRRWLLVALIGLGAAGLALVGAGLRRSTGAGARTPHYPVRMPTDGADPSSSQPRTARRWSFGTGATP